ncbi:hypothetical protein OS11_45760 [Dickeya oryzae]
MMSQSILHRFLTLLLAMLIAGCGDRVELHRGLSENDANEVIAALGGYHIGAEKRTDKAGVSILIDVKDMERSVNILNAAGLPRQARTNLGQVFQKTGVISTPLEERARYIYALSQEVESTLTQIDGVLVARVHVVLPERIAPGEPIQPASAAVFIKYRPELEPDGIEPRIRRMVASSIPGLAGKSEKRPGYRIRASRTVQRSYSNRVTGAVSTDAADHDAITVAGRFTGVGAGGSTGLAFR